MVRTQIYLTGEEQDKIRVFARRSGKKQSQVIRDAIDAFLERAPEKGRAERLIRFRGMWAGRSESEFRAVRQELDRRPAR